MEHADWNDPHHRFREPESFAEVLDAQMRRAPYLLVSLLAHALVALAMAGYAFLRPVESEAPVIEMAAQPAPPVVEDLEPPPEPPIEEEVQEPMLQEADLEPTQELQTLEETGDPDFLRETPAFDEAALNADIGLGGPPGGPFGPRGDAGGPRGRGTASEAAVRAGLDWLYRHQSPEGHWDCDEFMFEDDFPNEPPSDGPGNPVNDVGVTGLSLLAFLGANHTLSGGDYRDTVTKGVHWLKSVQLQDGLLGDEVGNPTLYNHAIATMALGEAYYFSNRSPILRRPLKKAVAVITRAQNPYGAWRYSLEPTGASDTSVTGWMIFALKTAEEGGIAVNDDSFEWAETWFESMTDPATGRTGYAWGEGGGPGSLPSRPPRYVDRFPAEKSEALTAVALLCRVFMTDATEVKRWRDHPQYETLRKQADLLARKPPVWDPEGGACDFYYWYYGTFAMNQWGGPHWKNWQRSLERALLPRQRRDGNFRGSWDPVGPWGEDGGRVYSTATCTLIFEVYYRYARVLGAR